MIHKNTLHIGHTLKRAYISAVSTFLIITCLFAPLNTYAQKETYSLTRAETVMMLILARTPDIPAIKNIGQFPDIKSGSWHEPYMLYAEKIRVITPDTEQKLHPESLVSRGEFLRMLAYIFDLPPNIAHPYRDVDANTPFAQYAGIARKFLLFEGLKSDNLYPSLPLTKVEAEAAIRSIQLSAFKETAAAIQNAQDTQTLHPQVFTTVSTKRLAIKLLYPEVLTEDRVPMVRRIAIPPSLPTLRTEIIRRVNDVRSKEGLKPLTYNDKLEQSAQKYADAMAEEGFFSHTDPHGKTLRDRMTEVGYNKRRYETSCSCVIGFSMGENLARGQKTAEEVMRDWLTSPKHKAAILNPDYTDVGVGVKGGIWVQHFGGVLMP